MTTLVFGLAGAAVGSLIPGVGTSIGWSIGSFVGGLFEPKPDLPPQFGPRLGDLKVQAATYGIAIPRCYGTVRLAGNIIWTTDIIETANVQVVESGGKGGGGSTQTQTTYSYSQSFAVGLCEGPIVGVRRIWANGKLIYSLADDASGDTLIASQSGLTVYLGTETQTPSALQESYEGAGNVPAYRGLAYVEFTDLQLEAFGNRTPNLEFEVVRDGSAYSTTGETVLWNGGSPSLSGESNIAFGRASGIMWFAPASGSVMTPLSAVDLRTGTLLLSRVMTVPEKLVPLWVDDDGSLWGWTYGTGVSASNLLKKIDTAGTITNYTANLTIFYPSANHNTAMGFDDAGAYYFADVTFAQIYQMTISGLNATLTTLSSSANKRIMFRGGDIRGRMYWFIPGTSWGYYDTGTLANTTLGSLAVAKALVDDSQNAVYIHDSGDLTKIYKYTADGELVDSLTLSGNSLCNNLALDDLGHLYVDGSSDAVYRINVGAWTLQATLTVPESGRVLFKEHALDGIAAMFFDGTPNRFSVYGIYGLALIAPGTVTDAEIVSDLCQLSDLTASDLNVTDLAGISRDGYVVANVGPIRGMLEPLAQTGFWDVVESDDDIKFVRRGGSVAVTIPQTDLAARESGDAPDPLQITRREETELPVEVDLTYLARQNNYQPGTQRERRQTTQSQMKMQVSVPIVMTDDAAQQTVDALLYSAWQERDVVEFSTSRKYAPYEPTDVLVVTVGGATYRIRATSKDVGANGVIKWGGAIEDASVYTQTSVGATMITPSNEIPLPPQSVLELLDTPLLRDVDDSNPGHYMGACGSSAAWRGQQLYRSADGTNYDALSNALTVAPAVIGAATTVLATCSLPGMFDEGNSVTVQLEDGLTLSSATRAEVLNGANAAALGNNTTGWEIIQFRTASQASPATAGRYTLSGLLRGRLGTEAFMATHAVGDRFVLLDNNLRTITQSWAEVNREFTYKSVTFGRTLAQTSEEDFTNTARRKKPLAPVQLAAARDGNGDWQIQWVRRTRLLAAWRDGVDAPLGEASEAYSIDVMHGSTVIRTIDTTAPEATYTLAQETSDFGSPTNVSLTINVYQISAEYGRGYAATGTFT